MSPGQTAIPVTVRARTDSQAYEGQLRGVAAAGSSVAAYEKTPADGQGT